MISENIRKLKWYYDSADKDNIGRDFIRPCINECTHYRRGTGFFSSQSLRMYAGAISNIVRDDIKIEILCSPVIDDKKLLNTLDKNLDEQKRLDVIQFYQERIIQMAADYEKNIDEKDYLRAKLLSYLIANDNLRIKIAVKKGKNWPDPWPSEEEIDSHSELYHQKRGYFRFDDNHILAFNGSFNESKNGLENSGEEVTVYKSWIDDEKNKVNTLIRKIDDAWEEKNKNLWIRPISKELIDEIKQKSPSQRPVFVNKLDDDPVDDKYAEFSLRKYQRKAIEKWEENNNVGMFEMATGSGKTRTAIAIIKVFSKKNPKGFKIIDVPKISLARQWERELSKFGLNSIGLYTSQKWENKLDKLLFDLRMNHIQSELPCLVTVSNTFKSKKFQSILEEINSFGNKNNLIVIDECHHFNKKKTIKYLPDYFNHRVGLSATLYDRYIFNENGEEDETKKFLNQYFEKITISYGLDKAIDEKNLVPYYYKVIPITLDDFEIDDLENVSKEIDKEFAKNIDKIESGESSESLQFLYAKRSSILASAKDKQIKLEKLIRDIRPIRKSLIYCGATMEDKESSTVFERQIDAVQNMLYEKFSIKSSRITADESPKERDSILETFKKGQIDALVSIRVLDEGIDLPICDQAIILSSDKSDRQFIQRRGRVLRRSDETGKTHATIYDFVIMNGSRESEYLQKQIDDEMFRVKEFASLAKNKDDLVNTYNLLNGVSEND
jgi:superfamily II DNA or RNA helicase